MSRTLGTLLAGVWNKKRFASIADTPVSDVMVYRVAQLALSGWEFCGADETPTIELERGIELATVDNDGNISLEVII